MTCPSFEDLSQFVDGEQSPSAQAELTAHIGDCGRCAELAQRLWRDVGLASAARNGGVGGTGCVAAENAVSYLLGEAGAREAEIEAHLRHCDGCVEQMAAIHRRLRLTADVAAPVPAALAQRARVAKRGEVGVMRKSGSPRLRSLFERLTRLPILVPTALAAGALFTVAVQRQWPRSEPRELLRSLPSQRTIEVTAGRAPLRAQPDAGATVLATTSRGDVLEIREEEPRWYRVVLGDGREGWIERHACE